MTHSHTELHIHVRRVTAYIGGMTCESVWCHQYDMYSIIRHTRAARLLRATTRDYVWKFACEMRVPFLHDFQRNVASAEAKCARRVPVCSKMCKNVSARAGLRTPRQRLSYCTFCALDAASSFISKLCAHSDDPATPAEEVSVSNYLCVYDSISTLILCVRCLIVRII